MNSKNQIIYSRQNILLLLLILVQVHLGYGQAEVILKTGEPEDLYQLNIQARKLASSNPDSTYILIEKIKKAADATMPFTIAEANISTGLAKMAEGKWTEAENYFRNTLPTFRELGDSLDVAKAMDYLGYALFNQGFIDQHLELQMQVLDYRLKYGEKPNLLARSYSAIGSIYYRMGDLEQAQSHYLRTLDIRSAIPNLEAQQFGFTLRNIGNVLMQEKKFDEAGSYYEMALDSFQVSGNNQFIAQTHQLIGRLYLEKEEFDLAEKEFEEALDLAHQLNSIGQRGQILLDLSKLYHHQTKKSKSLVTLNKAAALLEASNTKPSLRDAYKLMANIYQDIGKIDSALHYFKSYSTINDTLAVTESTRKLAELHALYKIEQKEKQIALLEKNQKQDKVIRLLLLLALMLAIGTAFFIFNANAKRKKAYAALVDEKKRTDELYENLQLAQSQLIQSEKMASLGMLTAGIAHEINNPINYINVSSEALQLDFEDLQKFLNAFIKLEKSDNHTYEVQELIDQAKSLDVPFLSKEIGEMVFGIKDGVGRVSEIINGLRTFTHHSAGNFEKEDLQENLDAALALLKSKIDQKNLKIAKALQPIPNINCHGARINQVFVNIFDNAIEAMDNGGTIEIKCQKQHENIIIEIKDNGIGMDAQTVKRIFDPFYTTKDIGKGTGLGMAISYGIIKDHNGEITVQSEIGKGTLVRIDLPINPEKINVAVKNKASKE